MGHAWRLTHSFSLWQECFMLNAVILANWSKIIKLVLSGTVTHLFCIMPRNKLLFAVNKCKKIQRTVCHVFSLGYLKKSPSPTAPFLKGAVGDGTIIEDRMYKFPALTILSADHPEPNFQIYSIFQKLYASLFDCSARRHLTNMLREIFLTRLAKNI